MKPKKLKNFLLNIFTYINSDEELEEEIEKAIKRYNKRLKKEVEEKIYDLQQFLECDLPSHFFDEKIKGEVWKRTDKIKSEKELIKYLQGHFQILKKELGI